MSPTNSPGDSERRKYRKHPLSPAEQRVKNWLNSRSVPRGFQTQLARDFGLSTTQIQRIVYGKSNSRGRAVEDELLKLGWPDPNRRRGEAA